MDAGALGGWVGGILGSLLGVLGGLMGTYFTIKNTKGPRERAFTIKGDIICWLFAVSLVAGMWLIPFWYNMLLWGPYAVLLLLGIRKWNLTQFRIRQEESGQSA